MGTKLNSIFRKALDLEELSLEEGLYLYNEASLSELIFYADKIRKKLHPENIVSYIVDRNINLSNICA